MIRKQLVNFFLGLGGIVAPSEDLLSTAKPIFVMGSAIAGTGQNQPNHVMRIWRQISDISI